MASRTHAQTHIKGPGTAADKIDMSQRPLSWRERATLVADDISLGCELLGLAYAERELGDMSASCAASKIRIQPAMQRAGISAN